MFGSIHSITTFTFRPLSLVRRQINHLKRRFCGCNQRSDQPHMAAQKYSKSLRQAAIQSINTATRIKHKQGQQISNQSQIVPLKIVANTAKKSRVGLESGSPTVQSGSIDIKHEYFHVVLRFLNFVVPVPSIKQRFTIKEKEKVIIEARVASIAISSIYMGRLRSFQRRLKEYQKRRAEIRKIEFNTWYRSDMAKRNILLGLSMTVLIIIVIFTLILCLILSGAFTAEECLLWAEDVGESIAMQVQFCLMYHNKHFLVDI